LTRIGLLGGTFNPPHLGHLICAQEAHSQLGLDRVLLIPVHTPPHKAAHDDPGTEHRLQMCRLAVAGDERLGVSRIEIDRGGPSYTVDTLRELHAPASADQLTLIMGGDVAATLPDWREPAEILRMAKLGVAERADADRDRILTSLRRLDAGNAAEERLDFFAMPRFDVSSSMLRERVAARQPIRYLVADDVDRYIRARGLYLL
jgi:nicotinate-nucleotide adenylyltransferase